MKLYNIQKKIKISTSCEICKFDKYIDNEDVNLL